MYAQRFIKHELTVADVERIDDLQYEHAVLFASVPQYAGMKRPKHHFLTHLARDIWNYGPPRGYWTFGYESFNKVIKAGAQRSNFKNETWSIGACAQGMQCADSYVACCTKVHVLCCTVYCYVYSNMCNLA
jgi:hypothetical protein